MNRRLVPGLIVSLVAATGFAGLLLSYARNGPPPDCLGAALERSLSHTRSVNVVTGVLLEFRGFDTIGEATVIFASVAAVAAAFLLIGGLGTALALASREVPLAVADACRCARDRCAIRRRARR
jgi:multisubunit Na+/H+ antiporter MnhB subunit